MIGTGTSEVVESCSLVDDACCHELVPFHGLAALQLHAQVLHLVGLSLQLGARDGQV